ncbi:AMP-binding protein [Spirillospora sp. NBC_01491]|uniref:AMP-binding protein n=1 Tax=Spirillospora sp. NBC_01491 TaxID=2976007 RepID=UPI002E31DBD4|nr:AMP-binding protein [Spirillospora sp. NBC_01491]
MIDGDSGPLAVSDISVTEVVLAAARGHALRRGDRPALIDPGRELGFARFAATVPAAASGLRRLGVRAGDVAAVHLTGAGDLALAVHALTAAGAVPMPLPPDGAVDDLAVMMTESGARFLLTAGETGPDGVSGPAAASLAATERSYVRQVFSFGDVPAATPFGRLVQAGASAGAAGTFPMPSPDPLRDLALRLSGPVEEITHADRLADLYHLGGTVGIAEGDVLVCCGLDCAAPTWIGLVDLCLTQGATFAGVPGQDAAALLDAIRRHRATAAIVTPAKLRALTFDHGSVAVPGVRLLVTGTPSPEVVQACRVRHGWTVSALG